MTAKQKKNTSNSIETVSLKLNVKKILFSVIFSPLKRIEKKNIFSGKMIRLEWVSWNTKNENYCIIAFEWEKNDDNRMKIL